MSVVIFIFQTKHKWGAVTFFSISIQKVGFLPTYQKNLNPKTQSCTSVQIMLGSHFVSKTFVFFLLFNPVWIFPKILAKLFSTFPPFPLFFKNAPLISPPTLKYSFCFVFQ